MATKNQQTQFNILKSICVICGQQDQGHSPHEHGCSNKQWPWQPTPLSVFETTLKQADLAGF